MLLALVVSDVIALVRPKLIIKTLIIAWNRCSSCKSHWFVCSRAAIPIRGAHGGQLARNRLVAQSAGARRRARARRAPPAAARAPPARAAAAPAANSAHRVIIVSVAHYLFNK